MKKILTSCTKILMALVILCSGMLTAYASEPWPARTDFEETLSYVNGIKSDSFENYYDESTEVYYYRYLGGGTVTGWELPSMLKGVDYEIINQGKDDIEFKMINVQKSIPYINVLVDYKNWPIRSDVQDITAFTNGTRPGHVIVEYTQDGTGLRLTYTAEGTVTGWEFPSLTEGKNYKIIGKKDNYIDIELINGQDELPDVNVLVDFSALSEIIDAKDTVYVNGKKTDSVTCEYNEFVDSYTYTYVGDEKVTKWDFSDLEENTNYQILESSDNSITVRLLNGQEKFDIVNAVLEDGNVFAPMGIVADGSNQVDTPSNATNENTVLLVSVVVITIAIVGSVTVVLTKRKKIND